MLLFFSIQSRGTLNLDYHNAEVLGEVRALVHSFRTCRAIGLDKLTDFGNSGLTAMTAICLTKLIINYTLIFFFRRLSGQGGHP